MHSNLIQPYLFFSGRCDEALAFYQTAIGAKVETVMRYSESPDPPPPGVLPPGFENKVMHSAFRVGESLVLASDGCTPEVGFQGFSLALQVADCDTAQRYYAALSAGGKANMPLAPTFWSPSFGMLTDRFGVDWMVMVVPCDAK